MDEGLPPKLEHTKDKIQREPQGRCASIDQMSNGGTFRAEHSPTLSNVITGKLQRPCS